jgi:hypothetical protein
MELLDEQKVWEGLLLGRPFWLQDTRFAVGWLILSWMVDIELESRQMGETKAKS